MFPGLGQVEIHGGRLNDFKDLLAGYKSTINIALQDVQLWVLVGH